MSRFGRVLVLIMIGLIQCLDLPVVQAWTEAEALAQIRSEIGPIVNTSKVPFIRGELSRAAEKFSEIQSERLLADSVNTSEFFLVHSKEVNALVIVVQAPGQSRSKNLVFMTTEMLRKFLMDDARYSFSESLTHLIGFIAHEYGHATDKLDAREGIENHYGRVANQAVELRADLEGDVLLEKAGYPSNALNQGLMRLVSYSQKTRGALSAGAGTHPDDELRLSVQRTRLTASRLLFGQSSGKAVEVSDADSERAIRELIELIDPLEKIDYVRPRSMTEASQRLHRLLVENRRELNSSQQLEALVLTLWMDQSIEESLNRGVTAEEAEARRTFAQALISTIPYGDNLMAQASRFAEFNKGHRTLLAQLIPRSITDHGLKDFRPHGARMEAFQILPKKELRDILQSELLKLHREFVSTPEASHGFDDFLKGLEEWTFRSRSIAPIEMIYEVWTSNPMNYGLRRYPYINRISMEGDRYSEATTVLQTLAKETHSHSINGLRSAALFAPIAERSRERHLSLKRTRVNDSNVAAVEKTRGAVTRFTKTFDDILLADPNSQNLLARYRLAKANPKTAEKPWLKPVKAFVEKYYSQVWKNRGAYAFNELTERLRVIEWNVVTEFSNPSMSAQVRDSAIRKSFIEYVRSIDLSSLDSSLINRYANARNKIPDLAFPEGKKPNRPPVWYSVEVERAFHSRPQVAAAKAPKAPETEMTSVPTGLQKLVRSFDTFVEKHFLNQVYAKNQIAFRNRFLPELEKAAATVLKFKPVAEWTFAEFEEINVRAFQAAFSINLLEMNDVLLASRIFPRTENWFHEAYITLIEKLDLPQSVRALVLKKVFVSVDSTTSITNPKYQLDNVNPSLFLQNGSDSHVWLFNTNDKKSNPLAHRVYRELLRAQVIRSLPEFIELIAEASKNQRNYEDLSYSEALNSLRNIFDSEIDAALKSQNDRELLKTFRSYANLLHNYRHKDAWTGKRQNGVVNTDLFSQSLLKIWDKANWSAVERYQAFIELTNHWVSPRTDEIFKKIILPQLQENELDPTIQRLLSQNRVYSDELRVQLAEKQAGYVLDKRQKDSPTKQLSTNDLFQSIELFDRMAPSDSIRRDEVFERIGWRLELVGHKLKAFVEDPKSTNWTKHNPRWISVASMISNVLSDLSVSDKVNVLNVVVEYKQNAGLPEWLVSRFYSSILRDLKLNDKSMSQQDLDRAARETTYRTREQVQKLLDSTTPLQRLPLIELILGSKNFELMERPHILDQILDRYMKFDPKTDDRIHLESYIAIIEPHERAVTLGYLLAQSQDRNQNKKGSLRAVLEAFPPVGIKLGQRGRTYGIFGPEYEAELSELKDNARPMSRSQIETIILNSLSPTEKIAKIKLLEVKGSASVGIVVMAEIEFPGQQPIRAAIKVQRPDLAKQIETNMNLGRRYITEVARQKNQSPSQLFLALVDAMDSQFASEIDFREEAKSTILAQKLVREIRKGLNSKVFGGWRVDVPDVLNVIAPKSNLVAYQLIDGETFKSAIKNGSLSESDRIALGELATQVALKMFFQHGVFDPDRHLGNWMIDAKTKTLYMIDLGQLTRYKKKINPFSADDRLALADFMHAYQAKNVEMIISAIAKMSVETKMTSELQEATRTKLTQWVQRQKSSQKQDLSDSIRELVDTIYELGHKMRPDFTFGALNGLLTLAGEKYVSVDRFEAILRSEVTLLKAKKAPVGIASALKSKLSSLKRSGFATSSPSSGRVCELLFLPNVKN